MSTARFLLILLICSSPVMWLWDGPVMHGILAGVAALGLAVVAGAMRPGETEFFLSMSRRAALIVAVPAAWMLIQVLPLGVLAHPIWSSAATALGHPLIGTISIDIGAGVMALGQYITIAAIGFWSATVSVDRQRAEWILFGLLGGTTLIGLTFLASELFGGSTASNDLAFAEPAQALDCMVVGIIVSGAAGIRTLERYETRHASPDRSVPALWMTFAACAAALILFVAVLWRAAPAETFVAAAYGLATLAALASIRRFGFGPWGMSAIAVPAVLFLAFLASNVSGLRTANPELAFASDSSAAYLATSQRILADAPLAGTGAGTFAALLPIYRDVNDQSAHPIAPTAAAAVAVELGRPMLWLIVATLVATILILLRASLQRGRDSFYPMAGAAVLIALLLLSFMNTGVLGSAATTIATSTLGLALAQRKSRTIPR